MFVIMSMELMVRAEFVGVVHVVVVVTVLVDDDGRAVVANESATERLREQIGHEHVVGGAVREHASGEEHHPLGAPRLGEVVGRKHDGAPFVDTFVDDVEDAELAREVETGDGFVEQQQVGIGRQRLGDENPLLLPAGELPERPPPQLADLEASCREVDEVVVATTKRPQQSTIAESPHPEDLVDRERHPLVVPPMLGDEGDGPGHFDDAVVSLDQAGEHREQGRLATAIRPDQRHRRAGRDVERARSERRDGPVVDARANDPQTGTTGRRRCGTARSCHENGSHSSLMRMILTRPSSRHTGRRRDGIRAALVIVSMVGLAACGGDDASAPDEPVIATTTIWADITGEVACGESIRALIPAGADPHTFEPSLRDRELVEHTSAIISNGLGLEQNLADLLDTARDHDVDLVEMANHIDVLARNERDDDHDDGDEHQHGGEGDPHVWQDPLRVAGTLDTIASALAAHDLATCTDEYRSDLVALDEEIAETLAVIPDTSRVLVTSHDSLAYLADRYGFEIIGTVIPSTSTLAETNAADLATLADVIEQYNVPAIFTEELESTADADALAARLGVDVVPLVTDSLTDDPDTDTYLEMMRHNAAAIAAALAP